MRRVIKQTRDYVVNTIKDIDEDALDRVIAQYDSPDRYYHTSEHLEKVLAHLTKASEGVDDTHVAWLMLAGIYHDAVYYPGSGNNKQASAEALTQYQNAPCGTANILGRSQAHYAIMATKTHRPPSDPQASNMSTLLIAADLDDMVVADTATVIRNVANLYKEFRATDWGAFLEGNLEFAIGLQDRCKLDLGRYIEIVKSLMTVK